MDGFVIVADNDSSHGDSYNLKEIRPGIMIPSKLKIRRYGSRISECKIYFIIFIFILVAFFAVYTTNIFEYNPDNARYFLSTLVQSQAAIISIIISLTLIAVQLASSAYTQKITEDLKKNPHFWALIIIYIFAIIGELFILLLIPPDSNTTGFNEIIKKTILFCYFIGAFTIISLFPFIRNSLNYLSPTGIISIVKREEIKINLESPEDEGLQSLFDILQNSISRNDTGTALIALEESYTRQMRIIEIYLNFAKDLLKDKSKFEKKDTVFSLYTSRLLISSNLALKNGNETIARHISKLLLRYGIDALENNFDEPLIEIIDTLHFIGIASKENGYRTLEYDTVICLYKLAIHTSEKKLDSPTHKIVNVILDIGIHKGKKGQCVHPGGIAFFIGNLGQSILHFDQLTIFHSVITSINKLADIVINNPDSSDFEFEDVFNKFDPILTLLISKDLQENEGLISSSIQEILESLQRIGNLAYSRDFHNSLALISIILNNARKTCREKKHEKLIAKINQIDEKLTALTKKRRK